MPRISKLKQALTLLKGTDPSIMGTYPMGDKEGICIEGNAFLAGQINEMIQQDFVSAKEIIENYKYE